jgi:hypothetical protein
MAPYIYKVGRSAPQGNPFTRLIYQDSSIWLRIREAPVRSVHPACRSWRSHISLIRTPIWTLHIWILIYSTRPVQWWSPNRILWTLTTPVWPVGPTGLTGRMIPANFGLRTYVPLFFGKGYVPKKYFSKLKTLRTMFNKTAAVHIIYSSRGWHLLWSPLLSGLCWLDWLLFNLLLHCSSLL